MKKLAFHLMLKPAGALCNLACDYCFFAHKTAMLNSSSIMSIEVLERLIKNYISSQKDDVIVFTWQGGEPALAGLDFFKRAVELQHKYCPAGKYIENDFQTNGTLLTGEWFDFFQANRFLVGLSIDGPPELHDMFRKDHARNGSAQTVISCAEQLKERAIPFNTLTAVNSCNSEYPLEVYRYLRDVIKSEHMQFLPVVEPRTFTQEAPGYWHWPSLAQADKMSGFVTPWSVRPAQYGRFLTEIFREWYQHDRGRRFIYTFEALLGIRAGFRSTMCTLASECGAALALDSSGALYSCDRFCYPEYYLGNIREKSLEHMVDSVKQNVFRKLKKAVPLECKKCQFFSSCHGGCPKNRFALTANGEPGMNYLCEGWKYFLSQTAPEFDAMAAELKAMLARQAAAQE